MCDKNDAKKVVTSVWNELQKTIQTGIKKEDFETAK